ncbi:hypothetical protein Pelo_10007 [Pelomyxa schiedti]|nr:hypothetical protein Pelo_10007 [Pelomyxa schiedti]
MEKKSRRARDLWVDQNTDSARVCDQRLRAYDAVFVKWLSSEFLGPSQAADSGSGICSLPATEEWDQYQQSLQERLSSCRKSPAKLLRRKFSQDHSPDQSASANALGEPTDPFVLCIEPCFSS